MDPVRDWGTVPYLNMFNTKCFVFFVTILRRGFDSGGGRNDSNIIPVGIVGVASSPTDTYVLYRKGKERKGKRICLTISWVADCIAILFFYYYLLIYLKPNFCFGADELTL